MNEQRKLIRRRDCNGDVAPTHNKKREAMVSRTWRLIVVLVLLIVVCLLKHGHGQRCAKNSQNLCED